MKRDFHHILLVEDDVAQQQLSRWALAKAAPDRCSVWVAGSGNEAIAYMIGEGEFGDRERHPFPTLVLTDLNMPDGDGFDVLEFMQCNHEWCVVPRIMLSLSDDDDDVRTAFLLGASAYHIKSSGAALEDCMRRIIEYWTHCEVPPVDRDGRLLKTAHVGRVGARYEQPEGAERMRRPRDHEEHEPGARTARVPGAAGLR